MADKITIVGAGNVGASAAQMAAEMQLGDIVLIDVVDGLAEGKALDISQAAGASLHECRCIGTKDWSLTAGSDLVIITSGMRRKPGMDREELLAANVAIVREVAEKAARNSPSAVILVVSNPLDAMVHAAFRVCGFPHRRVIGMAGALDSARFCHFVASQLGVNPADVCAVLLGGHGDQMVPLPRFSSVAGIPVTHLLEPGKLAEIVERTRRGGMEIVELLGYSAYCAPAAGAVRMARAILRDSKSIVSSCVYCDRQYNVGGYFVGVPVLLGKKGAEKIIELDLNEQERREFDRSLATVKKLAAQVDAMLAKGAGSRE